MTEEHTARPTGIADVGWLGWAGHAATELARRVRPAPALPRLDSVHPLASRATRRWRGLVAVPVAAIVGTASYPAGTRREDFLPARGFEPADWPGRWHRLQDAARTLAPLPPIELLRAGDGYWVVDGHNRVALARATGQIWIDADVTELLLPSANQSVIPASGGIN